MMSKVMGAADVVQWVRAAEKLAPSQCGLDTKAQRLYLISALVGKFKFNLTFLMHEIMLNAALGFFLRLISPSHHQ